MRDREQFNIDHKVADRLSSSNTKISFQNWVGWDESDDDAGANTTFGIDQGCPDLDIFENRDQESISCYYPTDQLFPNEKVFERGTYYYSKPVVIKIPGSLRPLPNQLLQNPMNMLVCFVCMI